MSDAPWSDALAVRGGIIRGRHVPPLRSVAALHVRHIKGSCARARYYRALRLTGALTADEIRDREDHPP